MRRHRPAGLALALAFVVPAQAARGQSTICQAIAGHIWSQAAAPSVEQTPLAALAAAAPEAIRIAAHEPVQPLLDRIKRTEGEDGALVRRLTDQATDGVMRLGDSPLWLLDRVEGSLGCHDARVVAISPDGAAHEVDLPGQPDPTSLCALSALASVLVDGAPALWIEQSGAFTAALEQSTISISAVQGDGFAPPCRVTVDYAVADQATHAFCDGIDCVPLIRQAEILAMRLRQQETAASLGAGALASAKDEAEYHRLSEGLAGDKQPAELPTFGVRLDTADLTFADQLEFPLRLRDGLIYLARIGHGGIGWRQMPNTLLALYRLRGEQVVPAASVYVAARRAGIAGVAVQ